MRDEVRLSIGEVHAFLDEVFPQMHGRFEVLGLAPGRARVRMRTEEADLRPGGTVSGPTLFTCADCAFYIVTLAMIGREALAVTTGCAINFLRKPEPADLIAEARILKLGKRLCAGDVEIFSEGSDAVVAHAQMTYSIPPKSASSLG